MTKEKGQVPLIDDEGGGGGEKGSLKNDDNIMYCCPDMAEIETSEGIGPIWPNLWT